MRDKEGTGDTTATVVKAKGFRLDSNNPMTKHINSNLYKEHVLSYMKSQPVKTSVLQRRFKIDSKDKSISTCMLTKHFSNNLTTKMFYRGDISKTRLFPFGLLSWDGAKSYSDKLFERETYGNNE